MARDKFTVEAFDRYDKSIWISGPDGLRLEVDYDDVDHDLVELQIKHLVTLLNEGWLRGESGVALGRDMAELQEARIREEENEL